MADESACRPQYVVFPSDPAGFAIDDQFYLGSSGLLVKPVVTEGATDINIYIADDEVSLSSIPFIVSYSPIPPQPYYHYSTHDLYFGAATGGATIKIPAPLGSFPALHQGGSILTRRDLVRRSAILTWKDPITLVAALDITGTSAAGSIYLDDGESYSNEKGEFVSRTFTLASSSEGSKNLVLSSRSSHPTVVSTGLDAYHPTENAWAKKIADVAVGEVIVLGLSTRPSCVRMVGREVGFNFEWIEGVAATAGRRRGGAGKRASELIVKLASQGPDGPIPHALITQDWEFGIEYGTTCEETILLPVPTGDFLCKNEGHIASSILRSRVNDGICDPECCDGSDETDGKVHCPNVCEVVGQEYRKRVEEEGRKNRVGGAIRKEYIQFGVKEKRRLEGEVGVLKVQIRSLEEREREVKKSLDIVESEEAGETERKRSSVLYERIVE